MSDYISKENAIKKIKNTKPCCVVSEYGKGYEQGLKDIIRLLNNMPAADVQPVKRGKWENEHYEVDLHCYVATCSNCGYASTDPFHISDNHKYCEYCGARMKQECEQP